VHRYRPPKELNEEVYTGLYSVMQIINHALSYEIRHIGEQNKQALIPKS